SPVSQDSKVLALTEENGQWGKSVLKSLQSADVSVLEALKIEFAAQIARLLATGLTLTHLKTHHGLGMYSKEDFGILENLA
ncbi:ChbG/HpnK family deacetylase, partial [Streptococcus pneumoniae]|uniref:ChbG/HpnK family deacetylase n=1 Tax=Streptococcus pneumoniae TaxID=1313 RepID=UPI002E7C45A4